MSRQPDFIVKQRTVHSIMQRQRTALLQQFHSNSYLTEDDIAACVHTAEKEMQRIEEQLCAQLKLAALYPPTPLP